MRSTSKRINCLVVCALANSSFSANCFVPSDSRLATLRIASILFFSCCISSFAYSESLNLHEDTNIDTNDAAGYYALTIDPSNIFNALSTSTDDEISIITNYALLYNRFTTDDSFYVHIFDTEPDIANNILTNSSIKISEIEPASSTNTGTIKVSTEFLSNIVNSSIDSCYRFYILGVNTEAGETVEDIKKSLIEHILKNELEIYKTANFLKKSYQVNHPQLKYIPRSERKEWATVGLIGMIYTRDDGTCIPGGYCKSNNNGIATKTESGYLVARRITKNIIEVLLK